MIINMDPTPAEIIETPLAIQEHCTIEESQSRLDICKSCENFLLDTDQHTKCKQCGCNISMLIAGKNEVCPIGKW